MGIPDDFCWVVKWGAMADLLSKDGPARDPARASYCEQRYQQGVELCRLASSVVQAYIDGTPRVIDSLHDLDAYADWQNDDEAEPTDICMAGLNMLVPYPVPDAVYTITLDLVANASMPANDAAYIELGRQELEAVLGYAEHLAMFKVSGPEFAATNQYWTNMIRIAAVYGERLNAASRYLSALSEQSRKEKYGRPRRKPTPSTQAALEA